MIDSCDWLRRVYRWELESMALAAISTAQTLAPVTSKSQDGSAVILDILDSFFWSGRKSTFIYSLWLQQASIIQMPKGALCVTMVNKLYLTTHGNKNGLGVKKSTGKAALPQSFFVKTFTLPVFHHDTAWVLFLLGSLFCLAWPCHPIL